MNFDRRVSLLNNRARESRFFKYTLKRIRAQQNQNMI